MLRYFVRGLAIACAESDATAAKLVGRGYVRCSRMQYLGIWSLNDRMRRLELAREDARRAQQAPLTKAPERLPNGFTKFYV